MADELRKSEAMTLEKLWAGQFGDAYVDRNLNAGSTRLPLWQQVFEQCIVDSILEVGCNIGANFDSIVRFVRPAHVFGVDVNEKALQLLHTRMPAVNCVSSLAKKLPFRDCRFDLVFTTGVLIHQAPEQLPLVMAEIVRCSKKYILCGEYCSDELTEVAYRGQAGALFKMDFGQLYQDLFPGLSLTWQAFFGRDKGWDDVTFWLFERS